MKKIVLTLCFLSIFGIYNPIFAETNLEMIEKLENSLYGFNYKGDSEISRLERLEKSIYGTVSTSPTTSRISKLRNDMKTDLIGQEIEPVEDTFAEKEETFTEQEQVAASNVSYPAIDEMEEKIFKKNFHGEDIKKRLSKLEIETLGKEYNDDLSTRTDRLKAEIKPESLMKNQLAETADNYYDYVPPLGADYHMNKYQTRDMFDYDSFNKRQERMAEQFNSSKYQNDDSQKQYSLTTVEKSILRKTFKNDPTEVRLARLESAMFGTNFASDGNDKRISRISSAYRATKSANKYDSNKFSQNVTTAVQIGTILLMVLACIL